jgi:hypothetical protein
MPKSMPVELRPLWTPIYEEVVWLHARWKIYRQLFGKSTERIDLLNRSASFLFNVVQTVLLDDVQLTLCKLGDPAKTMGKKNMTLELMLDQVVAVSDKAFGAVLEANLADFREKCKLFKRRRNKRIAHYDFNTLVKRRASPLPVPSREEIGKALLALQEFMNNIEARFTDSTTAYAHFGSQGVDGDALIELLKEGLRYEQLMQDGAIEWDDLQKHGGS